jgi:hypothetical protein
MKQVCTSVPVATVDMFILQYLYTVLLMLTFCYLYMGLQWKRVSYYCGHYWPVVQPWTRDGDDCGAVSGNNKWQRKPKY